MIRITGRWPFPVCGLPDFPLTIDACPLCGTRGATVLRAIGYCAGTSDLFAQARADIGVPIICQRILVITLFGPSCSLASRNASMRFLGLVVTRVVAKILGGSTGDVTSVEQLSQARLVALERACEKDMDPLAAPLDGAWDDPLSGDLHS